MGGDRTASPVVYVDSDRPDLRTSVIDPNRTDTTVDTNVRRAASCEEQANVVEVVATRKHRTDRTPYLQPTRTRARALDLAKREQRSRSPPRPCPTVRIRTRLEESQKDMRGCTFFDHRESHKVFTFTSKKPDRRHCLWKSPQGSRDVCASCHACSHACSHAGACTEDRLEAVAEARLQHDSSRSSARALSTARRPSAGSSPRGGSAASPGR